FPRAAAAWSTSATSGRRSRCWRRREASASSMPKTTTSSCTCTPSSSARGGSATNTSPKSTNSYRRTLVFAASFRSPGTRGAHRTLYDARFGGHGGCRHRRGARQGAAGLRRDAAPVPHLFGERLQAPQRPDLSHLSVAEVAGRSEGAVARHRERYDPLHCHG